MPERALLIERELAQLALGELSEPVAVERALCVVHCAARRAVTQACGVAQIFADGERTGQRHVTRGKAQNPARYRRFELTAQDLCAAARGFRAPAEQLKQRLPIADQAEAVRGRTHTERRAR